METLLNYAKSLGAVKLQKVVGPKGAFISLTNPDQTRFTLPVGGKSQNGSLADYKILMLEGGQAMCTVNEYHVADEVTL